ncbi:hypothetical protein RN001_011895 [Aquatica leii]|uniref:Uncharacterized protein n=1 Tax=Aquatica leii TaxID=1421715 RepID=A0AAN7SM81_9COLE|nr:hypothetical protein RN001_011895 [Aquatica leii]
MVGALEMLQIVLNHLQENYELLISRLEMRYGDAHLQQVYHAQIKIRVQKAAESLQEFEVDIARLARLAYFAAPNTFLKQLAIQTFVDGLRDNETQQTLRLARPKTLDDALVHALEFEAAKQASQRDGHRLCCTAEVPAQTLESSVEIARRILRERGVTTLSCDEIDHVRRHRTKLKKRTIKALENLERGEQKRQKTSPVRVRLRTATGAEIPTHGQVKVTIGLGNGVLNHQILVADISEKVILGIDVIKKYGFHFDMKNDVLKIDNEEIPFHSSEKAAVRVLLSEHPTLPARTESVVMARLDGNFCEDYIRAIEPMEGGLVEKGLLVGKTLVRVKNTMPVRILNINSDSVTLKKKTVVGECTLVSQIVRCVKSDEDRSPKKCPQHLLDILTTKC